MSEVDFVGAVIERSERIPVVVDFWASWCAPCRMLGPVLESLAERDAGRWELVKIDTEAQPDLAGEWNVMSIPAVKLFHRGRVVAEFLGALPEPEVRRWLDANLPDPGRERLAALMAGWPSAGTGLIPALESLVADAPDSDEGWLRLAQVRLGHDSAAARQALDRANDVADDLAELRVAVGALVELLEHDGEIPERALPSFEAARSALRDSRPDLALERLVDTARVDARFGDEIVRRAALGLIYLLGIEDDAIRDQRRRLAMALHS